MKPPLKKVLIIDDDPRNIFALNAVLKSKGYICLTASGMTEAITILTKPDNAIGIILLDMMMPEMDGYQAIPEIRKYLNLPIVAVTAQAMKGDRERCLEAGADDYLPKPVNVDELLRILGKHLA